MPAGKPISAKGLASIIERPDLLDLLDAGSAAQITLVTASAGSGKTMLVRSWMATRSRTEHSAWISVPRGEQDPQRFWSELITEVRRSCTPDTPAEELAPAPAFNPDLLIDRLVKDLAGAEPLTLVIDDVHEIRSPVILGQLTRLVDRVPSNVHVVLISRRDPQLGLHRRRLEGQLSEIRVEQLRFSVDEARRLFAAAGIDLSDHGLQLLHDRTEGWVAGLRLAALSLATHPDPERFLVQFSGSDRTVAEYLLAEVLDNLPAEVRRLLVNTSILDRINGDLGDLLTGDSGSERHLSALAEEGGFVIPLDARGEWFRLHHLFADLLASELRHTQASSVPILQVTAAHWLAEHGYVLEAINHALLADDHALTASLLVKHYFSLMLDGRQVTVRALVDTAVGRSSTPELAAVLAADELIGGSLDQAAAQLTLAVERAEEVPADRRRQFEAMLYVTRLSLARRIGDFRSVVDEPQPAALSSAPRTSDDIAMQSDVTALMLMNLGIVEVWSGRSGDGERHLREAEDIARAIERPYLEVSCQVHRAHSLSWRSVRAARPLAEAALATAERHGWEDDPVTGAALVVLGITLITNGSIATGERTLLRAHETLKALLEPAIGFELHTGRGVVNLIRANYAEAIANFLEAERLGMRLAASSPLALQSKCALSYAAVLAGDRTLAQRSLDGLTDQERNSGEVREATAARSLADGDARAALAVLEPTVTQAITVYHPMVLIRSLLLHAQAHYLLDEELEAQKSVESALDLAEADTLILPFLWIDSSDLLRRHPHHRTAHGAFLAAIMDVLSGREIDSVAKQARSAIGTQRLSETELRVLRFLPTNLTASEIASEIYVSGNTVKTHMRNIYTKLDAHSRGQAVERARESGLLSDAARSL